MAVRAAFPLSLVDILSSVPFSIDLDILDILDFFPSCFYTIFALSSEETSDRPRTEPSSAVSQDYLVLYIFEEGYSPPRLGPLDSPRVNGPGS